MSTQHLSRVASPLDALGDGKVDVARAASARVTMRKRKTKAAQTDTGAAPTR